MKKNLLAGLLATLFVSGAAAVEPFTVKDIRLEGIQRVEAGTVFSYLPVKVGDTMTDEKAAQAIKTLVCHRFLQGCPDRDRWPGADRRARGAPGDRADRFCRPQGVRQGSVDQGPEGSGCAASRTFDRATLEKAEQELKRQYLSRGRYAATITTTITPLDRNRVAINFNIDEGERPRSSRSTSSARRPSGKRICSRVAAEDAQLDQLVYQERPVFEAEAVGRPGNLAFVLPRSRLSGIQHRVDAGLDHPDKKEIYITISINEGERYVVSSVKLAGDLTLSEEEFRKSVKIKPGDVFSREKLNESTKAIADKLGAQGYAFANVNAAPELDKEKRQVAFTIFVDPGKRTYVRRINITGNTKTRDEVIRQEMRQMEGAWYDAERVRLHASGSTRPAILARSTWKPRRFREPSIWSM
jgi:outer membrane protein insertion porin family